MPEELPQPPPQDAIPAELLPDAPLDPLIDASPPMPISEPGVIAPAPFAQVYAPSGDVGEVPPAAPPPLPAQSYYPPAYPQPGQPPPSAWPEPVSYRMSGAAGYRRPGIITALAVTAIIVACLSGLTSLFSGCTAVVITTNARQTAAMAKATAAATFPSVTPYPSMASDGLTMEQRTVVIGTLRREMRRPLSAERKRQLDAFLAEHGKLILDIDDSTPLTSQSVTTQLGSIGQEFAAAGKVGPDFFVFKSGKLPGRLILKDDAAVYKPDDLSPNLTSSAASEESESDAVPSVSGLTPEEASSVIGRIRELSNGRLNSAQAATLNGLLQSPSGANWVTGSSTIPGLTAQVKSAAALSDGTVIITFNMGKLTLDERGNVVGPVPASPPLPTTSSTTMSSNFFMGTISVSHAACAMAIVDGGLSALLAVYLLVIAIISLRPSGAPRRLFVIYGLAKLACGIIGVIGFSWMMQSLSASGNGSLAQAMVTPFKGMSSAALTLTTIGLAYPCAVLLTLFLSKSARDYYKGEA